MIEQATVARYEFRIFGDDCRAIGERVAQRAIKQSEEQSADIYLLPAAVDDQNCKIRNGHLEVKSLIAEEAGFEQWQPTLDEPFPVQRAWLGDNFFPLLTQTAPPLPRESYSARQFVDEVIASDPTFSILPVLKHRHLFSLQGCRVEVCTAHVQQQLPLLTIALEAEQIEQIQEARLQLGLQNYANTNYVQMLQTLV